MAAPYSSETNLRFKNPRKALGSWPSVMNRVMTSPLHHVRRQRHEVKHREHDGVNICLRVPLSPIRSTNTVRRTALALPKPVAAPKADAAQQPFTAKCEVEGRSSSERAGRRQSLLNGPVRYEVHLRCRLNGATWTVHRRFSEFEAIHWKLVNAGVFFLPSLPRSTAAASG